MESEFDRLCRSLKTHMHFFSDEQKLRMYGLFKQATMGDCPNEAPPSLGLLARSKHAAWSRNRGMAPETAKETYVLIGTTFETKLAAEQRVIPGSSYR